jgi:glycosyltransferase involved in cell wall biosynthesis
VRYVPICVDGRMLGEGGTGVSTYARSLAAAVDAISEQSCRLVARRSRYGPLATWVDMLRTAPRPLHRTSDAEGQGLLEGNDIFRRAHVHFGVRRRLYPLRSDGAPGIMHWTYPVPMIMEGWINLYTVHDVIPLTHPDLTSIDPHRHRAVLTAIVAAGDGLTTVSQSARAAIVTALRCDPAFVVDTGQSVDVTDVLPLPLPPGLTDRGYFLVVGSIEPRKNIAAVLAAFRHADLDLPLVLVGPDGWHADPILAEIATTPRALRIPYADRGAVLGLIQHARALVFPSLAEGFGLPVVEAMALGTPVLTSDGGALAEIGGNAALTVDPTDIAAISQALVRLAADSALTTRLAQAGPGRAAVFSPARFAARLTRVYEDALQARAGMSNGRMLHEGQ